MGVQAIPRFIKLPTKPVCQCNRHCTRTPEPGKSFCKFHMNSNQCERSRMSSFEPSLDMETWNKTIHLKESHNCFAYAYNAIDPMLISECKKDKDCNVGFNQPGYAAGYDPFAKQKEKGCADMVLRLWGDNPKVKAISFEAKCPAMTSKIALIVDPKKDYHFLRQDPDGYWSHKPGAMNVTRLDASDRPIFRPDRSIFLYKDHKDPLLYTTLCGYFCVPRTTPVHMMSEVRQSGGSEFASSRKSTQRHKTRRQPIRGTRRLRGRVLQGRQDDKQDAGDRDL